MNEWYRPEKNDDKNFGTGKEAALPKTSTTKSFRVRSYCVERHCGGTFLKGDFPSKETLSMVIGLPLLIAVIAVAPSYFKSSPVEISKTASTVDKKVFDKKLPPKDVGNEESATVYEFVCEPDVDFEVVDENKVSRNKSQVRIKVNRARATLKLPITVWLSQTIPNRRADFEDGHVKVFQRIFVDAHEAANTACHQVIGRTFFGEGDDLEIAKKNAAEIAKHEIRDQYVQVVDTKAKDVLVIYDFYAPAWRQSADILVDKALQEYEVGKPRKLSRLKRLGDSKTDSAEAANSTGSTSPKQD